MEIATEATEATEQVPIIIYRNIETRDKYNHSDKGRECRKRYLDKNKEINNLWISRAIIKKKLSSRP